MVEVKLKKNLKRNAVLAAVVLFVGAAAWLNWSYNNKWGKADAAMANAEDSMSAMSEAESVLSTNASDPVSEYFAQARLTRQESRDAALSLLETAACAETASQEVIDSAMNEITSMAAWAMMESQIENELLAKEFVDCVAYLSPDSCTIAVPAPQEGLTEADVARVTDTILSNSDYSTEQINIIEVKTY